MQKLRHSGKDAGIQSHGGYLSIAQKSNLGIMPSHAFTSLWLDTGIHAGMTVPGDSILIRKLFEPNTEFITFCHKIVTSHLLQWLI